MAVPEERTAEAVRQQVRGVFEGAPPLVFVPASGARSRARREVDWLSLWRGVLLGAGAAFGGYLVATQLLPTIPKPHLDASAEATLVIGAIVAAAIAPLVHELGHVVGGLLVRFRFMMLTWGPVRIAREGKAIRVGLNRTFNHVGGIALLLPETFENLPRRTAVMIGMGPATSLVLGVAALIASYTTGIWHSAAGMSAPPRAIGGLWEAVFGVSSLGIALVTLMPGRTAGLYTDGAQILRYVRGGAAMERHCALMALAGIATGMTRPRDWPTTLIDRLTGDNDPDGGGVLARTLVYYQALDQGDVERAHASLTAVLAETATAGRRTHALYAEEAAFYELVVRGDVDATERWLGSAAPGVVADATMRGVLTDLIAVARDGRDAAALEAARARIEPALSTVAGRSGADALKAELVRRFLRHPERSEGPIVMSS